MKIGIIGTGIYGLALAFNMPNNKIIMWSENEELVKTYTKKHTLKTIIDKPIPKNINLTNNLADIKDCDLIIFATSAKYVRSMCLEMKPYFNKLTPICIASKGLETKTGEFLSDIIKNSLKAKHIAIISGPTFAIDLINHEPSSLSLASTSKKATMIVKQALENNNLKLRTNNDIYGTQICGSIKNVIALAAGILTGLGYNESTRAFLLTEALHDIKELLAKLECNPKTILSFAGIGDLILTCNSVKSRNYRYGVLIGQKSNPQKLAEYLKNNTTEGYDTLLAIKELIKNRHIRIPIINIIYEIVINNKNPDILPEFLINKN